METDPPPPATSSSTSLPTRLRQQVLAQRGLSVRDQKSRFRRTPPKHGQDGGDKAGASAPPTSGFTSFGVGRSRIAPLPKSLLPVTERKSQEENNTPTRRNKIGSQDDDKWDITPEGGSAGREGRQFAVANVGNNGRIYLRPTVRPAHQRYPQPNFVFPMTPPSTAGIDVLSSDKARDAPDTTQLDDMLGTPTPSGSTPREPLYTKVGLHPRRHRRAVSDSTVPDTSVARESEPGGFKIVITQPGEERPRTVDDMDAARSPLLDVNIPSWKLGTPRFSVRGTPCIRGSSYAPTEEYRSSNLSFFSPQTTPGERSSSFGGRSGAVPATIPELNMASAAFPAVNGYQLKHPLRSTYLSTHLVIEPAMFDSLTFKPGCDDRTIVRYSASGAVTAATPARLVAEITSPNFLDYELISDFFLSYRSWLDPSDLLHMLVARLRWALERTDEIGLVVRVRTFVAIRHWVLNYFMDDFVVDYKLRVAACNLINDIFRDLSQDSKAKKVQLKILAELKKCWRRVCAQYWDGPDFDSLAAPDVPIKPGGIAGHRDPSLDPSFWLLTDGGPPQLDGISLPTTPRERTSFYHDLSRAGHIDSIVVGDRPGTPENAHPAEPERNQASPTSITSVDVISCSLPTKHMRFAQPGSNYPLAAHPVDPSSVQNNTELVATTPRALMGKRVRPHNAHKRNGSLSDSMREPPSATEKVLFKNAEFLLTLPYAGSLVRGNLFPPGQAFVDVQPSNSAGGGSRHTTLFQPQTCEEAHKEKQAASAMSGQGMRKLLGSVRRALSTRGQGVSPTQGNFINISPIGPRGATTNRLPGTAIVPQARPRQNGVRPPVRIDLLGAEIAEDFKRAVREDATAEAEKNGQHLSPSAAGSSVQGEMLEYLNSTTHMDAAFQLDVRPSSDMGITTGSKSIVIVDDTVLPEDHHTMTGALPVNTSVEAFAETFMPSAADPTPPNTPPGRGMGTPRRSSYILGQHVLRTSISADPLPPFVPDMETLGSGPRPSEDLVRPSLDIGSSPDRTRPPLSGVRGHRRHGSSRSYLSNRSTRHRRYASFTSGIVPQSTVRSFDATTYSEASIDDNSQVLVPQPLRVLRRRPGGDLRAATNVGDLDPQPLRRSRSVGSLTTYTDSIHSSYLRSPAQESSGFVDVVTSDYSPTRAGETFSLGAIAEQTTKGNISLFSTHSSKPIMRPSFEAEAQKLAQIPDDLDDDGGVESALLKLEGRYEKRAAKLSMDLKTRPHTEFIPNAYPVEAPESSVPVQDKKDHRHVHIGDEPQTAPATTCSFGDLGGSFLDVAGKRSHQGDVQSFLSEASYSSTPLLDGGLTEDSRSKRTVTREWTDRSILQGPDEGGNTPDNRSEFDSRHPSYDIVEKTNSMDKIQPGNTMPEDETRLSADQSFLNVESDDDLSSELSDEDLVFPGEDPGVVPFSDIGLAVSTSLPVHPLGDSPPAPYVHVPQQPSATPPSPPMTLIQALQMAPESADGPLPQDAEGWVGDKPLPPTPDTTPTTAAAPYAQYPLSSPDPTGTKQALRDAPKLQIPPIADKAEHPRNKYSVHLPFILAFDSEILAQQFTLIEKDALNEIDWKELIEMRWKNAEPNGMNARSWVSFLRDTDARGVEVVIARFNIMVKWAVSEIVLTQDIEERARCIIKLIHIAAHCRRLRNFATMSQLTIALSSHEVAGLTKTWALVPASDRKTSEELEELISPTKNFHNLRSEMENGGKAGAAALEMGCIPFVGIYTHDLLFNAQRPSEIASSPTTAPLVNFERCRVSAGIVKNLLRLLEASSRYTFQPIEGITERCLWMGALTDEEIRKLSEGLE
ncbi:guanine nucleotide exchange factor LTE1 [Naviculisporaceae sp. PSN 640]